MEGIQSLEDFTDDYPQYAQMINEEFDFLEDTIYGLDRHTGMLSIENEVSKQLPEVSNDENESRPTPCCNTDLMKLMKESSMTLEDAYRTKIQLPKLPEAPSLMKPLDPIIDTQHLPDPPTIIKPSKIPLYVGADHVTKEKLELYRSLPHETVVHALIMSEEALTKKVGM